LRAGILADIARVYPDVANWWYHYYSRGENKRIRRPSPEDFALSHEKYTPDFENFIYDYGICHPQIGVSVTAKKSIVLIKTTVGCSSPEKGNVPKSPYIVGYFRVGEIDKKREIIHIDPPDSLLLLSNPIKLDRSLAERLFLEKRTGYWADPGRFVRRVGSTLRNRKARLHEIRLVLAELFLRRKKGSPNFLGKRYRQLLSRSSN